MTETGDIMFEKVFCVTSTSSKDFLQRQMEKEFGSEVVGGSEDSQLTQPKTKNPIVRTGGPVKSEQPSGSLTQEIDKGVLFSCEKHQCKNGETC